jgi:predicted Zn-dependent peptidase
MDDDAPALAILTSLLTGGRTSRLYRRMILEDRIATGVFSSLGPGSLYPQLLQIDATPLAPATTATVETAIYEEIARLASDGPTEIELTRVRNQIAAALDWPSSSPNLKPCSTIGGRRSDSLTA